MIWCVDAFAQNPKPLAAILHEPERRLFSSWSDGRESRNMGNMKWTERARKRVRQRVGVTHSADEAQWAVEKWTRIVWMKTADDRQEMNEKWKTIGTKMNSNRVNENNEEDWNDEKWKQLTINKHDPKLIGTLKRMVVDWFELRKMHVWRKTRLFTSFVSLGQVSQVGGRTFVIRSLG